MSPQGQRGAFDRGRPPLHCALVRRFDSWDMAREMRDLVIAPSVRVAPAPTSLEPDTRACSERVQISEVRAS